MILFGARVRVGCGLVVVALVAGCAPALHERRPTAPHDALIVCRGESTTIAALAARRGVSRRDLPGLLDMGFTADTLCQARDAIIREGLETLERPKPTNPGEYLEWRTLSLQDENGAIDPNGLMRGKAHVDMMREARGDNPSGAGIGRGTWTSLGPGNIGGRVRALVIDPDNPTTMLAGSVSGGIWRTTNGGTSWSPINDFMANLAVSTLVMQPGTPTTIFAGTGEGYYNADGIRGVGIFKSTDGGTTWTLLPSTSTAPSPGLTANDFTYVNRLAMSANGSALLAATRTGIFRSTDGGVTFTRATLAGGGTIPVAQGITDIDFHPTDTARAIAANYGASAFYSVDGGATWTQAAGLPGSASFPSGRVEMTYAPSDGLTVYASVDLFGGSLYKSVSGGALYTLVFDGAADNTLNPLQSQGWYDNLLWVSPTDPNLVVWGGVDNFRSTNGGTSFSKISQWFSHNFGNPTSAHADQHIAVAHPGYNGTTNRTVFFGNDGGVYRADDVTTVGFQVGPPPANFWGGWSELNNGLAITQFYGAAGHPGSGRITGGTQDNGTLLFNPAVANPSENWTSPFGGDGGFSAYDSVDQNYFYGEYVYLTIHRNSTGGAGGSQYIWASLGDANSSANAEFIAAFIKDPNNNDRLLGGAVRLWRTNNAKAPLPGGPTWEVLKDAVPALPGGGVPKVSAIAVAPGNSNIIFAGYANGRVDKTTTGASDATTVRSSWTTIDDNATSNPLPNRRVTRVTIDPNNSNTVYVTFGGFSPDNVYKSTDGGMSWTNIMGPPGGPTSLPNVPVRDLEVHPVNSNWLYVGTEVGVFSSEDGGATWFLPHDGPSNVSVDELFFLGSSLYSVTHGRGLFATTTTSSGPIAANDSFSTAFNTTLTVPAPGVLGNDNANGGGAMTAFLLSSTTNGALTLNSNGSFTYVPNPSFEGTDAFGYRAVTVTGSSNVATVSIVVVPQIGRPTGLSAIVAGNSVTFTWSAGVGSVTPTGYDIEAGTAPGTTIAVLPVGAVTTHTVPSAPDGIFYIRVRARAGVIVSAPSSEIQVRIGSAALPGSATNLLASAAGSTVSMAWMPPQTGGTLTTYRITAAASAGGAPIATLDVPVGTTLFSVPGVPAGVYFIRIVALGPAGAAAPSNEVAVTVPGACAAPQPVLNLRRIGTGSLVVLQWDLATSGAAPTQFTLQAGFSPGASDTAVVTTATLGLQATAPPGTYHVRVMAQNSCGSSAPTPDLIVNVP